MRVSYISYTLFSLSETNYTEDLLSKIILEYVKEGKHTCENDHLSLFQVRNTYYDICKTNQILAQIIPNLSI